MGKYKKIGAIWERIYNNEKQLSGELETETAKQKIYLFRNTKKEEGSHQPDYNICIKEDVDNTYNGNTTQQNKTTNSTQQSSPDGFTDDIPF